MDDVAMVLVHGANHRSAIWKPTVAELERLVPDARVLALDLPGRGGEVDLRSLSMVSCATDLVEQIDAAGLTRVVLVGHSLGGAIIPGVAATLGRERVAELVFVAATIPDEGDSIGDILLNPVTRAIVRLVARRRTLVDRRPAGAAKAFCNGMTDEQRQLVLDQLCPDAPWLVTEPLSWLDLPKDIPRTWVLTGQDRAIKPDEQHRGIERLGGVDNVRTIDTCHDVMVSEPAALAAVLAGAWMRAVTGGATTA